MEVLGSELVASGLSVPAATRDVRVYKDNNAAFDSLLNSAISLYKEADTYQKRADRAALNFAMGYTSSAHDLGLVQKKASTALQYTVRVTNSVVDAYKELLNMQL